MSLRRLLWIGLPAALLFVLVWWLRWRASTPPEVPFARVKRERLVSTLVTNGKAEPWEWMAVRAELAGVVERVAVERGARVARGALIAEVDAREARGGLAATDARVAQAQAEVDGLRQGGRAVDLAEIESGVRKARLDLEAAQKDLAVSRRLAEKQAATRQEVVDAGRRVEQLQAQLQALERKRGALVSSADTAAAEARLQEALAAQKAARQRLEVALIWAPITGVVFQLEARPGMYLSPGALVASVGLLDKLRVRVYVDEPELGRIRREMPVTITWDALPGRQWKGSVDRTPTEVVPLGTRQVGEVLCTIDNPNGELLPGTNVNAEITASVIENGLVIPKEALRRQANRAGVFWLRDDRVNWREVTPGPSSVTRVVVLDGLAEGDAVALAPDRVLADGDRVRAVFP
ncbi:MAG: efflux RND transporter periplasmic adaptor subunit [Acidobacteria bacterium]|nr:efflux RND transporter periplasmic adaptor subunit [Acidobacteriota bacterium]